MYSDARQLPDQSRIEGDICIIGAGAAGISMALEWINTPYKVILLEGGGLEYDDAAQNLLKGESTGQRYYPLKSSRLHCFGGTTGHWGGFCAIFDHLAFEKRNWVNESGWPFSDKELLPFYKRAGSVFDLGEYGFNTEYWIKKYPELQPLPLDTDVFWSKLWRYRVPSAIRFGTYYKDAITKAGNIHLLTYAHVTNIKTDEHVSTVTEVTVKNLAGKEHKISASYFVLAACAIQNARLLLSSNTQAPAGIGNDHDLVGRYFMENAELKSAELWLAKRDALTLYMRNPEPNLRAEVAITPKMQAELGILNGMLSFTPLEKARNIPPYISTWTSEDPREANKNISEINAKADKPRSKLSRLFESEGYQSFEITLRLEQAPNPLSRITLGREKDEFGNPRPSLHWAFSSLEKKSARTLYQLFGQQVGKAGIGRVKMQEDMLDANDDTMPPSTSGGWHHMGTTRMHNDPKKGVVDANCRVHGIDNLYVAGSSCFPNGGAVNPTFTIVALSLRLSDHLKSEIKNNQPVHFAKSIK